MADTTEIIDCPEWLGEAGRRVWCLAAPELRRAGLLAPAEETAFARYCDHVARWLKLRGELDGQETYETVSKHGTLLRIHPKLTAMMQIERSIEALEDRFALTPLWRFKLKEIRARAEGEGAPPPLPRTPLTLPFEVEEGGENGRDSAVAANMAEGPFGILN